MNLSAIFRRVFLESVSSFNCKKAILKYKNSMTAFACANPASSAWERYCALIMVARVMPKFMIAIWGYTTDLHGLSQWEFEAERVMGGSNDDKSVKDGNHKQRCTIPRDFCQPRERICDITRKKSWRIVGIIAVFATGHHWQSVISWQQNFLSLEGRGADIACLPVAVQPGKHPAVLALVSGHLSVKRHFLVRLRRAGLLFRQRTFQTATVITLPKSQLSASRRDKGENRGQRKLARGDNRFYCCC